MKPSNWYRCVALAALTSACASLNAAAQTTQPQTTQPALDGIPMIPYSEPAFGFEMQIPAGWEYDRARFQQFKNSIGLLRGRSFGGRRGLQLQIFHVQPDVIERGEDQPPIVRMPPFEDWVIDFAKALGENTSSERLEWETRKLPPRVGAVLTYGSQIAEIKTRTHTFCLPFDPGTIWIFVYSGTVASEADELQLRREFEHVIGTLKIYYDPAEAELQAAAFEKGRTLIERLHKQANQVRLDNTEYFYDISLAGQSIGYLRRRASREDHTFTSPGAKYQDVRPGLRYRERTWRFDKDGTVRYRRLDMFSSFDGQDELIENQLTQIPAPDVQPQQLLIKTDRVIRKHSVLFSSYTTSLDSGLPDPGKPLSVGPVYLDLAWARLLPGLLYGAPQEPHAFVVYNTDTRAISSQTVTLLGSRELPGHSGTTYAFEVQEGLIDRPALYYADERGNLVRLVANGLVLMRTTEEDIERRFAARRDAARLRFGIQDD